MFIVEYNFKNIFLKKMNFEIFERYIINKIILKKLLIIYCEIICWDV